MLSQKSLEDFASEYRTEVLNVMREYLQNLLLSYLYQQPQAEHIAFKGGTALKILYRSPRFSEDLDFSSNISVYRVKNILAHMLGQFKKQAIPFEILEAKETSGGYFALSRFETYGHKVNIEWNVSLRKKVKSEPILVTSDLIPPYQLMVLPLQELVSEKVAALLRRKKPRDFFDLYFLLRGRYGLESIIPLKKKLMQEVKQLDAKTLKRELKLFLPVTHHALLNQFTEILTNELSRL